MQYEVFPEEFSSPFPTIESASQVLENNQTSRPLKESVMQELADGSSV